MAGQKPPAGGAVRMPPSKRAVRWAVLLVFLACCLFIAWNVPYTQDDWAWGTPVGIKRWLSGESFSAGLMPVSER